MKSISDNYGYPTKEIKLKIQNDIKKFENIENIDGCYRALNIYIPNKEIQAESLYQSYIRSNRKGYNKTEDYKKVNNNCVKINDYLNMEWRRKE